jgi:hypothetical protein
VVFAVPTAVVSLVDGETVVAAGGTRSASPLHEVTTRTKAIDTAAAR